MGAFQFEGVTCRYELIERVPNEKSVFENELLYVKSGIWGAFGILMGCIWLSIT